MRVALTLSSCYIRITQGETRYKTDAVWLSWLSLVKFETAAAADAFDFPASTDKLEEYRLEHWRRFKAVPQYKFCTKPKHLLRANYAIDIDYTGPLIRTWCMSFEALLQVLKLIAHHSNYKNVCERVAKVWAIRYGLMLSEDALSIWCEAKVHLRSGPTSIVFFGNAAISIECARFGTLNEFELVV